MFLFVYCANFVIFLFFLSLLFLGVSSFFCGLYHLGNLLREKNELNDSIKCYEKALKLNPSYAMTHSNLALIYILQQQYELAHTHLLQALNINPSLLCAQTNLQKLHILIQHIQKKSNGSQTSSAVSSPTLSSASTPMPVSS